MIGAIAQARAQLRRFGHGSDAQRPDPLVGCLVLTKGGKIFQGYRGELESGEHAEFTVLERKMAEEVAAGATVYTTLEPCTHRTFPKISCADRLIERRVRRVFIGMMDPDPRGNGYDKLRDANIDVVLFDQDLMAEIEEMNRIFTKSRKFSNSHRPNQESAKKSDFGFTPLANQMIRLGVPRADIFRLSGFFNDNPDRKCIGPIISVENLSGVDGVHPESIIVKGSPNAIPLSSYIEDKNNSIIIEGRNGKKALLFGVNQLPLDSQGGIIAIDIAPSLYSVKIAMREMIDQIKVEFLEHIYTPFFNGKDGSLPLPCHLHCDGVLITGDNKVILAQRGADVDMVPFEWAASFGEGVEWDGDRDEGAEFPHPKNTLIRGLMEELGISEEWLESEGKENLDIKFLELGFQFDSLIYILFSLIEIKDADSLECLERARNYRKDKETRAFACMEFSVENCAKAVVRGNVEGRILNYAGRFGLMLAALSKYGPLFTRELRKMETYR